MNLLLLLVAFVAGSAISAQAAIAVVLLVGVAVTLFGDALVRAVDRATG